MGDSNHVILVFIKAQESDSEKPTTILLLKNIPKVLRWDCRFGLKKIRDSKLL